MRMQQLIESIESVFKLTPYQRCLLDIGKQIDDFNRGDGKKYHPDLYKQDLSYCKFDESRGLFYIQSVDLRYHNKLLHPIAKKVHVHLSYGIDECNRVKPPRAILKMDTSHWVADPKTGKKI